MFRVEFDSDTSVAKVLTLNYLPDQNGEATITLLGELITGDPTLLSLTVTVDAVNDRYLMTPS